MHVVAGHADVSVDACHARSTAPADAVAVSEPGTVGACVSGTVALATLDGVLALPAASTAMTL